VWKFPASLLLTILVAVSAVRRTPSQTVESVTFPTTQPRPALNVPLELRPLRALIQHGVGQVPEGRLLVAALTLGQKQFRLTPRQATDLTADLKRVYAQIVQDPAFAKVDSSLADAVSDKPDRPGHYFLFRPATVTPRTRMLVFLHGFGGNFEFYEWVLKEAFPDAVIVAPPYGIAWARDGGGYLHDVLADVGRRLSVKPDKPWLLAISAGGPAGFDIYNAQPDAFRGFVCIASCPEPEQVPQLRRELHVLMINGADDHYFDIGRVRTVAQVLAGRLPNFRSAELPGDHFFLLHRREETLRLIKQFAQGGA
jgi:hypothetical protein